MPERPDLEYVVPLLCEGVVGRQISAAEVRNPIVMRVAVEGAFEEHVTGCAVEAITRRAHMVVFTLSGPNDVVVSPMLAGRFRLVEPKVRRRKACALVWALSDGRELRYVDDVQMGKVYLVPRAKAAKVVPGFEPIGIDVLSPDFTLEAFAALVKKRRDQVKVFLMDKTALDAMGNAYADEVLHRAGLHPKVRARSLKPEQIGKLRDAIVTVLTEARDEVASRKAPMDEKIRDFLRVRNRKGEPCPSCGTTIRAAGVRGHDAFFCPTCQPDSTGRGFVDWGRLRK